MPSTMRMTGRVVTLDNRSTDLVNAVHYEDDRPRCDVGQQKYWPGKCHPLWGWPAALWRWTTEILTWSMPSTMRMTGRVVTLDSRSTDLVNAVQYEDDRPRCDIGQQKYWPGKCHPLWGWPAALWRWTAEVLTWSMPSTMRMTGRVVTLDSRSTDLVNAIHYEDDRPRCNVGQQKYWPGQCHPLWGWPAAL